jgi:DNA helicase-2/ATP-dependent DNA helicase PcrA
MPAPNSEQVRLAGLPVENILVVAPAGCGKTEALAARAQAVVERSEVVAPRKVLGLSFSNKARDNLASRLATLAGPRWRQNIVVSNFHGLAARVIRAHGRVLEIPPDVGLPDAGWRRSQLRDLGISGYQRAGQFEQALHHAKLGSPDDDEVMERLLEIGDEEAIEFERRLRDESRLDHDDVIRHGSRLLSKPSIQSLYRAHFGMVIVDEVQDLTITQFEMVRAVGGDRVTYAGDPAQGIYSFTGADPVGVFERIEALGPERVEFNISYRSAPAVLRAVNALAAEMGATELKCGSPDRWPDDGHVISLERNDTDSEAAAAMQILNGLIADGGDLTIGVIGRRGKRFAAIRSAADGGGIEFEDWSLATHVPGVVSLIQRMSGDAIKGASDDADAVDRLGALCTALVDGADTTTLDELSEALATLRDLVAEGMSAADAIATCRASPTPGQPVAPGVHLLTGHKGKGQEFDWVFVIGLEDGHIPDFRSATTEEVLEELRILHVIVSRARYGLVVTFSRNTPTKAGWRAARPSPWLGHLRKVATRSDHS